MYESGAMVIFGLLFREVAEKETRVVTPLGHPKLGRESYALVDLYCVAPDCDCRRVLVASELCSPATLEPARQDRFAQKRKAALRQPLRDNQWIAHPFPFENGSF